ncbi:unnamed protein product [Didymodactylos carnosus]|uniref:Uncharacterized protein n=1 Tax=Didymodactylos carnosus TaxID=1234261 RepID=A0A813WUR0_9BILA|nr:unnamed protein product [Didymodactylos carnosus]CAF0856208.1 unnamed protein product [Didymodactylos carnosus]CAF3504234.1 unnamed protein product [Didymodactylos carnosus]CAF3643974.1 unnamed protein product [Didymodactylos carnosus]
MVPPKSTDEKQLKTGLGKGKFHSDNIIVDSSTSSDDDDAENNDGNLVHSESDEQQLGYSLLPQDFDAINMNETVTDDPDEEFLRFATDRVRSAEENQACN